MIFLRWARHVASIVTLLLTFGLSAFAQSQPPPPGALKGDGAKPNEQGERAQDEPKILIGTKGSPAFVTVTKTPEEAAQEQADRNQQATTQRWTIGTGVAMAALTLALIVVGVLQWNTYRAQLALTRALERARIALMNIDLKQLPDRAVEVSYDLHNLGRSVAYPTRLAQDVYFFRELPEVIVRPEWTDTTGVLQANEPMTLVMTVHKLHPDWAAALKGGAHLWIIGRLEYRDVFKEIHERGFAFGFDNKTQQVFPPQPDPGYNYET